MIKHRIAMVLALLLMGAVVPTAAAQPATPVEETFWVQLALPEVEVDSGGWTPMTPDLIRSSLGRQRSLVQAQMEDLKAVGLVAEFQMRPRRSLVTFTGGRKALDRLRDKGLVEASGLGAPDAETLAAAANQLDAWIDGQSHPTMPHLPLAPDAIAGVTVSLPNAYIFGYAPGEATVDVSVLDPRGSIRGSFIDKTWTDGTGYFRLRVYNGCTRVSPQVGDRVRVQAGAESVTVDVVNLTVAIDERTNVVSGTGPANSQVILDLYSSTCTASHCQATVTTNSAGNYSYLFPSPTDIYGGDYVYATWRNSAGDGVQTVAYAPAFSVEGLPLAVVSGRVRTPGEVRVELRSGSGVLKDWEVTETFGMNDFEVDSLSHSAVAGDQIVVISGGETWRFTLQDLAVQVDAATNRVLGRGPANTTLAVWFRGLQGYASLQPTTNASGTFNVPVIDSGGNPIDVMGGDTADLGFYDTQRNHQYLFDGADYLLATVSGVTVTGYTTAYQTYTLVLADSTGAVKETHTSLSSPLYGLFAHDFTTTIVPGDRLTLTVGPNTRTMTVPTLDAAYNPTLQSIGGHAPPSSRVWVKAYHRLSFLNTTSEVLSTTSGPRGAYGASLASTSWGGAISEGDAAKVMTFDADDNAGYVETSYDTPRVVWQSVPPNIVPNVANTVSWLVGGGMHAAGTYLVWDTVSHPDPNSYAYRTACQNGLAGSFEGEFIGPTDVSTVYMRARSYVGTSLGTSPLVYTDERAVLVGTPKTLFVPLLLAQ